MLSSMRKEGWQNSMYPRVPADQAIRPLPSCPELFGEAHCAARQSGCSNATVSPQVDINQTRKINHNHVFDGVMLRCGKVPYGNRRADHNSEPSSIRRRQLNTAKDAASPAKRHLRCSKLPAIALRFDRVN